MDEKSGYNPITKTYHSTTPPPTHLPPPNTPFSTTAYTLSLLKTSPFFSPSSTALIDASTGHTLSYSLLFRRLHSLSTHLPTLLPPTSSSRHVALILSPPSIHIPVLYLSLLSLNIVFSPANPLLTPHELAHIVSLSKPTVVFTVSSLSSKLRGFGLPLVILDSPQFQALLVESSQEAVVNYEPKPVPQTDTAMILYSSGTTGKVKGVELTHRNHIALLAFTKQARDNKYKLQEGKGQTLQRVVVLLPIPMFHVYGLSMLLRCMVMADTIVVMERFNLEKMLAAVERYRVTYISVVPPLMVAMVKSELTKKYDLSSLDIIACGGAPLGKEVAESFKAKFPSTVITQGYGMTETATGGARSTGQDELLPHGSVGRLFGVEGKIIDPSTGEALPPGQKGELWLRGPTIMKGYVGDKEATTVTFSPDGWMKSGDLCYIDINGYLYIVDRLKELIKYKGYQVPPAELEELLLSHPDIDDAAVVPFTKVGWVGDCWVQKKFKINTEYIVIYGSNFGYRYPNEEAGQIPMAFVVRKPGRSIIASQVMDYVAKQVSPYKKIRRVAFVNSIPKNPSGKILRRELLITNSSKL